MTFAFDDCDPTRRGSLGVLSGCPHGCVTECAREREAQYRALSERVAVLESPENNAKIRSALI